MTPDLDGMTWALRLYGQAFLIMVAVDFAIQPAGAALALGVLASPLAGFWGFHG